MFPNSPARILTIQIVKTAALFMRIHYKAHKMAILKGGGSGKFPPVKTNKLTWMQALKKWNEAHSTAMWCVPRMHNPKSGKGWAIRTTAEYDEVRDIMLHGALSKGQILKGEKRVAKGKEAPFVGRSRARAQKGMTEAERAAFEEEPTRPAGPSSEASFPPTVYQITSQPGGGRSLLTSMIFTSD